jgi:hypothetical protein
MNKLAVPKTGVEKLENLFNKPMIDSPLIVFLDKAQILIGKSRIT